MTFGSIDVMFENPFFRYILYSISEIPFIMLGYLSAQITMVRNTGFVKFVDKMFWINIFAPIWYPFFATIQAIIGFYDSSSVRWVRAKILEVIVWLREVTATEWLTFFAIVFFWPLILVIYIVKSLISLFAVANPVFSVIIDPLLSLVSLTSPEDIDISKFISY